MLVAGDTGDSLNLQNERASLGSQNLQSLPSPYVPYGAYAVSVGRHAAVAMTRMAR